MTDPEAQGVDPIEFGEQPEGPGEMPMIPELPNSPEDGLPPYNPFAPDTKLVDPDGREYIVTSTEGDAVHVKSADDGPEVAFSKPQTEWVDNIRTNDASSWKFKEPTTDQLVWSYPALEYFIAHHPNKDQAKANIATLTDKRNTDVSSILAAGEALHLPPVTLVDLLRSTGFSEETIKQVNETYLGKEKSEENPSKLEAELVKEAEERMKEVQQFKSVLDGDKSFDDLTDGEQSEYRKTMANLRLFMNNFKETKTYRGMMFSLKGILILMAVAVLFQMMVLSAHAGAGKGGR